VRTLVGERVGEGQDRVRVTASLNEEVRGVRSCAERERERESEQVRAKGKGRGIDGGG
jgi:hypothetical protein